MLATILIWIYILITCFIIGSFAIRIICPFKGINPGSCVVCGFCVLTAYAGYFSLFTGVGLAANIVMLAACICIVVSDRKTYAEYVRNMLNMPSVPGSPLRLVRIVAVAAAVVIILICAYYTAAGRFAYDTGTYHAQSIHWIESFGVVKGLAYMQTRLGFNSSYFCLCALYSMHFMGQSLHALSGFLAVFVMLYALAGYYRHLCGQKRIHVSDFAYIAPFAYFIIVAVEIVSPATDHGVIWLIIWLCIRWTEVLEEDRDTVMRQALLCVMAVFLVSIKLSVGVLALLVIFPAYILIREKKTKDIIKYILAGVVLILPYFIRNVLITGWLIYPFPAIDLFNLDWKIPVDGVKYEADEIVVWARYTRDVAFIDQSIREWFPIWWSEQGTANRYLSLSAFTGAVILAARIAVSLVYSAYLAINAKKGRFIAIPSGVKEQTGYVFFGMILLLSFGFFMITAPSNRFGYGYILMIPLFAAGDMAVNIIPLFGYGKNTGITRDEAVRKKLSAETVCRFLAAAAITLFLCLDMLKGLYYFAGDSLRYAVSDETRGYLIRQKDYPQADAGSKEWQGMNIYYPTTEGDQIWYHAFPAILYEGNLDGIERRGSSVKDGFRLAGQE